MSILNLVLCFCGRAIDYAAATANFLYVGAVGSGKTVLIRLLLQSIWGIATRHHVPTRMLVYDSKRELLPVLYGIFERLGRTDAAEKITLLNPFDTRGVAWDMAKDIRRASHANELAAMLIPSAGGDGRFWSESAQAVVGQIIQSFIQERRPWDLRDICCAVETVASIRAVVKRSARTRWVLDTFLNENEPKTTIGVMATIHAALRPFRDIAIQWQRAPRKISLGEWLHSQVDRVLVLGSAETSATAVEALNAILFKRLSQMILEEEQELGQNDPRRIWIILDEFVRAGRLPGAVELATKGRSKGAAMVLGFQDVDGLRAVYGKEVAHEILGQCSNIALLRMNSTETAEWASDVVGEYRSRDRRHSTSSGTNISRDTSISNGQSEDEMITDRRAVLPSYFQRIPPVSKGPGIGGVFLTPYWTEPGLEASQHLIESTWLFKAGNLWPLSAQIKGYEFRDVPESAEDDSAEWLKPWDDADYDRLNVKRPPSEEKRDDDPNQQPQADHAAILKQIFARLAAMEKRTNGNPSNS
ncbi:MAG TPA: type IV secretion system DNA-binding domain-containing protein [Blastocatellia bacterium]|nr:type IV secretion system DNA-binding domain-containing protein [Blastocatellia bacterium]